MKAIHKIESITGTMMNMAILVLFASVFIVVFFFPEQAGEIYGRMANGFHEVIKNISK